MVRTLDEWRRTEATALPRWVKPQLTRLVEEPPEGPEWLHEIKFDDYRMHARLDRGAARLLTRTGPDGGTISRQPLKERKERLRALLSEAASALQFSDHQLGQGRAFCEQACGLKLEGIV